jgi:muramoyltetrapeptide carboxypeptidase LdcA involved in peptidoglycan recycling
MLRRGDIVAAVSLSWGGAGAFPYRYQEGKQELERSYGIKLVPTKNALKSPEWLAKNPQARAEDLHNAFLDKSISGIFSIIGGDDSIRLIPYLNIDIITENPKVFIGYSDTTITHFACFAAGIVSFYGPSIMSGFAENCGMFEYTKDSVFNTLFNSEKIDWSNSENQKKKTYSMEIFAG